MLAARRARHLERERDVLADGLARQQPEVLEHDADLAPQPGHVAAAQVRELEAGDVDVAGGRDLVADEQLDERALAGAGRADEEHEVALGDDEVDVR